MEDSRLMATPVVTNLKKVDSSTSELAYSRQYRVSIGSLMHLVNSRPYICFVVNTLSQFMVEPREVHWVATKLVLKYLQGTVGYGLQYLGGDGVRLQGFSDLDWARNDTYQKSTYGCCFSLGSTVISWFNRKWISITLSSTEAEHMATSLASCEAIWLHKLLTGLFGQELEPTMVHCNN
jgi:hypothetical protein